MDPLSLTASLLAILGAGGAITKGLNQIRRLKHGADIHRQEPILRYTPLLFAILYGVSHIVYWLLQKGANVEARTSAGSTPHLLSVVDYNAVITDWLIDRSANYKILDRYGEGLLHRVARFGGMTI